MSGGARTAAQKLPADRIDALEEAKEFLILEGDLVDSDGTVFLAGDFVSYQAGTHHNSWTEKGCLIAVFEWQRPA